MKLEVITLITSLLSSILWLAIIFYWQAIPIEIRTLFQGGNIGAQILGALTFSGFIGIILFFSNLMKSKYKLWWLRSIGFISYILLISTIGYYV